MTTVKSRYTAGKPGADYNLLKHTRTHARRLLEAGGSTVEEEPAACFRYHQADRGSSVIYAVVRRITGYWRNNRQLLRDSVKGTLCSIGGELRLAISGEEEEEGVAAGLSAMEAEFREIDENGSWNAIYQVGKTSPARSRWKWSAGEAAAFRPNYSQYTRVCSGAAPV